MTSPAKLNLLGASALISLAGFATPAQAELDATTCSALTASEVSGATITAAEWMSVDGTDVCVVNATRKPFLDIEVILPRDWTGRFFMLGGAGFDGWVFSGLNRDASGAVVGLDPTVSKLGVARASSNGGNRGDVEAEASPGIWLSDTPEGDASLRDYMFQGLGTTIHFSKTLIETVYGAPAKHSYFSGCSNGGRNAYAVAERWPDAFDGIATGCEGMAVGGQVAQWVSLARTIGTDAGLSAEQYAAAYQAGIAECDAKDGAQDGMIAKPSLCAFDPAVLSCDVNDTDTCLSEAQVGTLNMLYSDLYDANGKIVYSGYPPVDFSEFVDYQNVLGGAFAWMATDNPDWFIDPAKKASFDISKDLYRMEAGLMRKGIDHDRLAIADYVATGGKLISWHSVGDALLSANDHLRNFKDMTAQAALIRSAIGNNSPVDDSARFFLVPGGNHTEGDGPSDFDLVSGLVDWVENGTAPSQFDVNVRGVETITCAHPARTVGRGDGYACE